MDRDTGRYKSTMMDPGIYAALNIFLVCFTLLESGFNQMVGTMLIHNSRILLSFENNHILNKCHFPKSVQVNELMFSLFPAELIKG